MRRIMPAVACLLLGVASGEAKAQSAATAQAALEQIDATIARHLRMFSEPERPDDPEWVASALAQMARADQHLRRQFDQVLGLPSTEQEALRTGIGERVQALDEANRERLRRMLPEGSWFRSSVVGRDVARDAWLIVQHADQDVAFQREILARMRQLPKEEVEPVLVAYLHDRVAMHDGRPQRFGTQGRCVDSGGWQPHTLEAPIEVDARRAEVGLGPLDQYIQGFAAVCPARSTPSGSGSKLRQ